MAGKGIGDCALGVAFRGVLGGGWEVVPLGGRRRDVDDGGVVAASGAK